MRLATAVCGAMGVSLLVLAGCSDSDQPMLMNLAAQEREPDEFGILPTRPLEMPTDTAELPEPTPGGVNRADPEPRGDIAVALGGSRAAATASAVPTTDQPLLAHASRFGRSAGIRDQIAAEDLEFRQRNRGRVLERLFSVNVYHRAYRVMALDRYAELERWRARGVRTSAAPPDPAAD